MLLSIRIQTALYFHCYSAIMLGMKRFGCVLSFVLGAVLAGLCGCSSTKAPGTDSLAAIEVKGRAPLDIARAVFRDFPGGGL